MKTMTCKQLGGACNMKFQAQSFEEMAELSKTHGKEMFQKGDKAHLETLVRDTSLRIGANILETMINSDRSDQQPTIIHPDGRTMTYAGRKEKTFVTVLGDIILEKAFYIDENGRGYFPRDTKLGFDKDSLSDGVKRMIGHTASGLSFKESSQMIEVRKVLEKRSQKMKSL